MITISNSVFNIEGNGKKDKVYGITLKGAEDVRVENCEFATTGYSAILNHLDGAKLEVVNCKFACEGNYNPIEGGQSVENGAVLVKGCEFTGAPGNNYINFYNFKEGVKNVVSNCSFEPTVDNNVIRISNNGSKKASFDFIDLSYNFTEDEANEYTSFLLCQDYTNKDGKKQDFSILDVTLENVKCNGTVVSKDGAAKGSIFYVYDDVAGIITGEGNDPHVVVK